MHNATSRHIGTRGWGSAMVASHRVSRRPPGIAEAESRHGVRSCVALEDEDLPPPQLEGIAAPACVAAPDLLVCEGQAKRAQVAQVQAQERRGGRAREGEGGQQRDRRHGHDRAPPHVRAPPGAESPAAHLLAGEVPHVTLYDQLASAHLRARVHPRIACDGKQAGAHARPEELDAPQVALDPYLLVAVARDGEEVGELRPPVAVPDGERLDLATATTREAIRGEALGLEPHGRRLAQRERQRHYWSRAADTRSRRSMRNGPRLPP